MFSYFKKANVPNIKLNKQSEMKDTIDWGLRVLGVPSLWQVTRGKGIKVAVLDTGIAKDHPDLKGAVLKGRDFTGGNDYSDRHMHGTACSSIIGARANDKGIVGVAPECEFLIGKVLNDNGAGRYSWILNGMKWAMDEGADIISMSLGGPRGDSSLKKMCEQVISNGTILIVAAGNDGRGRNTVGYPGCYPDVITVGSVRRGLKRSTFSSTGPSLEIMTPGEDVLGCVPPDGYTRWSGTSASTPFCAGVAALILAHHRVPCEHKTPCTNQQQMLEHLIRTATDMDDPGFDNQTGWGIIDPRKAIYW